MPSSRLLAVGDVNIQKRGDPTEPMHPVRDVLTSADAVVGNLEMCLSDVEHDIPWKAGWIQSDPRMVQGLTYAEFSAVTTANNTNFGSGAIAANLETLDAARIPHTGSGLDHAAAHEPARFSIGDLTAAMLGYSCLVYPRDHEATATQAGIAAIRCTTAYEPHPRVQELPGAPAIVRSWPQEDYLRRLESDIAAAKSGSDVVVCYFHMGVSSEERTAEYQDVLAKRAIDFGADIVLGASAHKPQAVAQYRGRPIFFGLGNFAFDWEGHDARTRLRDGLLAEFEFDGRELSHVSFRPLRRSQDDLNQVHVLDPSEGGGREIVQRVKQLSAPFGTRWEDDPANHRVILHLDRDHA